ALGMLEVYDDPLPHVYGYLLARCGDTGLAEDLTAEAFLAAVQAVRKPGAAGPSVPWLIGVARHKLADDWRAAGARAGRGFRARGQGARKAGGGRSLGALADRGGPAQTRRPLAAGGA